MEETEEEETEEEETEEEAEEEAEETEESLSCRCAAACRCATCRWLRRRASATARLLASEDTPGRELPSSSRRRRTAGRIVASAETSKIVRRIGGIRNRPRNLSFYPHSKRFQVKVTHLTKALLYTGIIGFFPFLEGPEAG